MQMYMHEQYTYKIEQYNTRFKKKTTKHEYYDCIS